MPVLLIGELSHDVVAAMQIFILLVIYDNHGGNTLHDTEILCDYHFPCLLLLFAKFWCIIIDIGNGQFEWVGYT